MYENYANTLIAMAGFALATSASPGPVNIVSAMAGAKFGACKTIPYVLGATIGFVSILAITGSGLSTIILAFPWVERVLGLIGCAYMLYIAWKIARASMIDVSEYAQQRPPGVWSGIVAQYVNPKAWFVSMSAISVYVSNSHDYGAALIAFCAIFFAICFPSLFAWCCVGASFSKKQGRMKIFNLSMAVFLVVSIIGFLVELFQKG
jgi:threonine/homoserine/homoserine lactone efflux protein